MSVVELEIPARSSLSNPAGRSSSGLSSSERIWLKISSFDRMVRERLGVVFMKWVQLVHTE